MSPPRCGWPRSSAPETDPHRWPHAAVREAPNGEEVARAIAEASGVPVDILSGGGGGAALLHRRDQDPRPPGRGQDRRRRRRRRLDRDHPRHRRRRRREGALLAGRLRVLADELIASDPPSAAEIRKVRDRIDDLFDGVEIEHPAQAVAVGGSATSLRRLVGAVLEYETLERGIGCSAATRRPTSPAASSSTRSGSASSPPACCCWRRSPSCSASRCRSARAACARASSSTSSTATRTGPRRPRPRGLALACVGAGRCAVSGRVSLRTLGASLASVGAAA